MNKEFIPTGDLFLDTDSDPKSTQGSDFILNTMVTTDGRGKVSVNCYGNQSVYFVPLHTSGAVTMLGSCPDNARNRIIMLFTDSVTDSIQYYEPFTGNSGIIVSGKSNLNFNSNFKIYNPKVVGDLFYWTDGNIEPKKTNYIRLYNTTNSIGSSYIYSSVNKNVLDAYKRPGHPITVTPITGLTGTLRGKSYQWAHRNIFVDGEKSVLSDSTTIYFTDINNYPNGETLNIWNGITGYRLSIPVDVINNDISSVEIYVRDNEKSNWYLYDTVLNPSGDFYYVFDDKNLRIQADQTDLSRPYDFMPQLAKHQELIEKNRIIYANITEGFDPVIEFNVNASIIYTPATDLLDPNNSTLGHITNVSGYNYIWFDDYDNPSMFGIQLLKITYKGSGVQTDISTIDLRYIQKTNDPDRHVEVISSFIAQLATYGITATMGHPPSALALWAVKFLAQVGTPPNSGSIEYRPSASSAFAYRPKGIYKTLKTGDFYLGGIQYYDKNFRIHSVTKLYQPIAIPNISDSAYTPTNIDQIISLRLTIFTRPPQDAYYWSPVFTKRIQKGYYLQFLARYNLSTGSPDLYIASDGNLRIKINNIINAAHDLNKYNNIGNYVFEKGDRIRLIASSDFTGASFVPAVTLNPVKTQYDVEILGFEWPSGDTQYLKDNSSTPAFITDANGNKVQSDYSSYIVVPMSHNTDIGNSSKNFLFEIYRPLKQAENTFYFPCGLFNVGNPGTTVNYHISNVQNQNYQLTIPAIVDVNPGDTYLKIRDCRYIFTCTDDNYSDYYTSNFIGTGRPNIYNINAKKANYQSAMRYSELLIENTRTNNLNQFLNNFTNLKSEFGAINSIREVGDVLKVIQDKKETSIYVGKEEVNTAGGQKLLMANPNLVLGNQNRADELRGTTNSHSVVIHDRNMYYWDGLRKEVIRSAPNGQEPISEYMMKTFFKTMTDYTDVIAGFDQQNNMYLISFIGGASPVTLGFIEPKLEGERPKWISFFSFVPQNYLSMGNFFSSFIGDNSIWKHNSTNVSRCHFYDVKYDQRINLIFNKAGAVKKLFRNIGLKTNKRWSIPTITIEADESYPRGFLSKIPAGRFKLKEGDMFSEYLKNMLTHSSTPSNLDLINGDELRGFYIKHELLNSEDDECWILGAQIGFDVSNNY